jgi:hypothetical protein
MVYLDSKTQPPAAILRPLLRLKAARRRKLRRIKRLIDQGGYDTDRKLDLAMDRLLDDLLG